MHPDRYSPSIGVRFYRTYEGLKHSQDMFANSKSFICFYRTYEGLKHIST